MRFEFGIYWGRRLHWDSSQCDQVQDSATADQRRAVGPGIRAEHQRNTTGRKGRTRCSPFRRRSMAQCQGCRGVRTWIGRKSHRAVSHQPGHSSSKSLLWSQERTWRAVEPPDSRVRLAQDANVECSAVDEANSHKEKLVTVWTRRATQRYVDGRETNDMAKESGSMLSSRKLQSIETATKRVRVHQRNGEGAAERANVGFIAQELKSMQNGGRQRKSTGPRGVQGEAGSVGDTLSLFAHTARRKFLWMKTQQLLMI